MSWEYADKSTPPEVFIEVMAGSTSLLDMEFAGATTNYSIPASTTSGWSSHDSIVLLVGAGETTTFSGDLVSSGSESYVLLSNDSVTLTKYEEGEPGSYTLSCIFSVDDETGTTVNALISVVRNNTSDTAVTEAIVAIDGNSIPNIILSANEGVWDDDLAYTLNQTYNVSVSIGGVSSTATITAYDRDCRARITSPANNSEFTAGTNIELAWSYTGSTPDQIVIGASSGGGADDLWVQTISGSTTSYSVPTSSWAGNSAVFLGISVDATSTWSGDLADNLSGAGILYTFDFVYLYPAGMGPGDDYYVYVSTESGLIASGGSTTATAEVSNLDDDSPCPDGTVVTFTFEPTGLVTPSSSTATTVDGVATITLTAGQSEGIVTISASALGDSDTTTLQINNGALPSAYYVAVTPDPDSYPGETYQLPADGSSQVVLNLRIVNIINPSMLYTGDVTINAVPTLDDYVVVVPETVTATDGTAQFTVYAGSSQSPQHLLAVRLDVNQLALPEGVIVVGTVFPVDVVAP